MSNIFDKAIKKDLRKSLDYIHSVESKNDYKILSKSELISDSKLETYYENNAFRCTLYANGILEQKERHLLTRGEIPFSIINDNYKFDLDFSCFSEWSSPITKIPTQYSCKIIKYTSASFSDNPSQYYRLLVPSIYELNPGSFYESAPINMFETTHIVGLLTVQIQNYYFHLYAFNKKEESNYFIIESLNELTYSDFIKYTEIISLAYSFITGSLPRDQRYIIASKNNLFTEITGISLEPLAKSYFTKHSLFPSSVFRMQIGMPHNILFSQKYFNRLCQCIYTNEEYKRILYLIVEGHTLSNELKASIYSVALEALTNLIATENEDKFIPITDKCLAKDFRSDLKKVLENYKEKIAIGGYETLVKKINVINQATNNEKLLKPFEILGIILPQKDIDCISKRNDFLHGRIPKSADNEVFNLEQIILSLLFSVSALALKYFGYSGYILYYPAINEIRNKMNNTDYLVRTI